MKNSINKELRDELALDQPDVHKLEILIDNCSDVDTIDYKWFGQSLLQQVIYTTGFSQDIAHLVTKIIEKGAEIDYQDWIGDTALHAAILSRTPQVIELLLKNGANPNLISFEEHETALDFAQSESFMEDRIDPEERLDKIIKLLLHYNGKTHDLIFCKTVDTYLFIRSRYEKSFYCPTGLFTLRGNIFPEDIPNIDKEKCDEFLYWLLNGPHHSLFEEEPEHSLVVNYYKKQDEFLQYFRQLLPKEIVVGDNLDEVANKIYEAKKEAN